MNKLIVRLCAWLLVAPAALAQATDPGQQANPAAGAADPDRPVPRVAYRSVFADTPTGAEADRTPWAKANEETGQFRRGHIDLLKWEADRDVPDAAGGPRQGTGHHGGQAAGQRPAPGMSHGQHGQHDGHGPGHGPARQGSRP